LNRFSVSHTHTFYVIELLPKIAQHMLQSNSSCR